ncbi:MAG TPA: TetR/AcrR family transcriptional regulator [Bacillota bacterium]|nr:TetR/AcrR family transcriptional regulator [Bacillota bacterium]
MNNIETRREREKRLREAEIVDAAERVFYQKGFDAASMDEIAQTAQFTKRTVYQYFTHKEELYFAVALKSFRILLSYFETAVAKGSTGIEKFQFSAQAYYQFYQDQPAAFHILNHCSYIQADRETSPHFLAMANLKQEMVKLFAEAIETGKKDGTIRRDLDAAMGVYATMFLSIGFLTLLAQTGADLTRKIGVEQDEFVRFSFELIYRSLRA